MNDYVFNAYAHEGEIDLNRIAASLKAGKKYKWEDPLVLSPLTLELYDGKTFAAQRVYLYYFGAAVFFNCPDDLIALFYRNIAKATDSFRTPRSQTYRENYSLQVSEGEKTAVTNDCAIMQKEEAVYVDIIAYTLAKSVALEQVEARVEIVFDKMEEIIAKLDRGQLAVPDSELARTAATILNFKYRSLSHIMILDKPDITWDIEEADRFYSTLANFFELSQRYSQIKHKSDTLLDITEVFTGLSHARRSARLEWIIIILIAIEIALFLLEMARG
ncbi:MAG: RMD1 family protein [Geobacter sp.]|nr:RMD1 family protein [Geobacter sp.]